MIYADNAATTKLDIDAYESMKKYLIDEYGNPSQPYSFSRAPKKALAEARADIALCIGALPEEIYFTSGGTESDNWALKGAVQKRGKKGILISSIEHHAVINAAEALKREGYSVSYLDATRNGVVLPDELERRLDDEIAIVSVMMANNEIGSIQPVGKLAKIAHNDNILFHTDAVQAVGHIPIDVKELDVDMLSASAHKFNGPRGIGFLYIKKGVDLCPFMDGGSQEKSLRAGTENVAAIVGMSIALKNNCANMENHTKHIKHLESVLLKRLEESGLDYIRNGAEQLPGNISLSFADAEGEMILHRMDLKGICISTGSACDSVNTQVSHVVKAIGIPEKYAKGTIRISMGKDNTEEEAISISDALVSILK